MARYLRIRCIVKTARTGAHERINAICGLTPDGSHWTLTHKDAVSQVENGICRFYIERPRDQRSDVIVAMDGRAHRYSKRSRIEINPTNFCFSRPVLTSHIHPTPYRARPDWEQRFPTPTIPSEVEKHVSLSVVEWP